MGEEKLKKHLSIFDLEVSDDTRVQGLGSCSRVWWQENKLDIGELHLWMARGIVKKNKAFLVLKLHLVVELLQVL